MLSKLTLINFRSHRHSVIHFSEGVTIIVGRGQAGKTNIKRALEWLCMNRPRGEKVHSYWCEKGDVTRVELETHEGYIIEISKVVGDSVEYTLQYPEGRKTHWSKVHSQVPDKVIEVLNLCELNIQHQLDQPYLITTGTGDISRAVNQAVDLDSADTWIAEFSKRRKNNTSTIAALKEQLDQAQYQIGAYASLEDIRAVIEKTAHVKKSLIERAKATAGIESLILKIKTTEKYISHMGDIQPMNDQLRMAHVTITAKQKLDIKQKRLNRILDDINKTTFTLETLREQDNIEQLLMRINRITAKLTDLTNKQCLCEKVFLAADTLDNYADELAKESDVYVSLLDELGVCPLCFTPVDDETLNYVIEGLQGE